MVLRELLDERRNSDPLSCTDMTLQIYATDLDGDAVDKARKAFYPINVAADLTPEQRDAIFWGNFQKILDRRRA